MWLKHSTQEGSRECLNHRPVYIIVSIVLRLTKAMGKAVWHLTDMVIDKRHSSFLFIFHQQQSRNLGKWINDLIQSIYYYIISPVIDKPAKLVFEKVRYLALVHLISAIKWWAENQVSGLPRFCFGCWHNFTTLTASKHHMKTSHTTDWEGSKSWVSVWPEKEAKDNVSCDLIC